MEDYKAKYKLVWQEEFDYEGPPNTEKWSAQVGGHGWGNNEDQFYTESGNAWVEGGKLIIEARPELDKAEAHEGKEITSARIRTVGKGDWQYGVVEVRAKIPQGLGIWPAIWMMPTKAERRWPACGEIDIMEYVGWRPEEIWATVHTGAFNHIVGTQKGNTQFFDEEFFSGFNDYSVEWNADKMIFRVNGNELFVYEPKAFMDADKITDEEWPFDKEFHLILNVAFGGNFGGARGKDVNILPARMEVEYVRVYQ